MSQIPLFERKEEPEKHKEKPLPANIGAWQRYTTGFGEKFMRKLGFEDRLGKDGQGIAQPIATKKRPEGLGLGADGFKEATSLRVNREIAKEYSKKVNAQNEEEEKERKDWWKDSSDESESESGSSEEEEEEVDGAFSASESDSDTVQYSRRRKTYRVFKTVEQLLQEQNEGKGENEEEPKPIIFTDHTGRVERKVDASMGFALSSIDRKAVGFEMLYNLESLASMEQSKILSFSTKNQRQSALRKEKQNLVDQLKSKIETDSIAIHSLSDLLQRLQRFSEESSLLPPRPSDVLNFLEDLQIEFPVEYYRYKVYQLLPWLLQPAIEQEFMNWNPLENADLFVDLVQYVKDVILIDEENDDDNNQDNQESHLFDYSWMENTNKRTNDEHRYLITTIFTQSLLKRMKDTFSRLFDIFNPTHFTNFVKVLKAARDIWDDRVITEAFLTPVSNLVKQHLQDWSIQNQSNPVDFFASILRFQTILPGFKSDIQPTINFTLNNYISSISSLPDCLAFLAAMTPSLTPFIEPTDTTAQILYARKALTSVLQNAVLPKLAKSLRQLEINPGNQQQIELFTEVMDWSNWFDGDTFSAVLEGEFFPQWLDVLYDWLHQPGVVLQEVLNWVEGWRSLFVTTVLENPYIVMQFNRGWDVINEVLEGGGKEGGTMRIDPTYYRKPTNYRHVIQNRMYQMKTEQLREKIHIEQRESSTMTLRDALDMWGGKHGIELKQIESRTYNGKKLYLFGVAQFYIDNDVAFVKVQGESGISWEPMSMQEMLDLNTRLANADPDLDYPCFLNKQSKVPE